MRAQAEVAMTMIAQGMLVRARVIVRGSYRSKGSGLVRAPSYRRRVSTNCH